MYEVEVKLPAGHAAIRERLADLDAETVDTVRQRDTYYDHPARDFAVTDEALRLRRTAPVDDGSAPDTVTASLTYKGPLVDDTSKTREELETVVDDPDAADAILRALGFTPAADVEKEREQYTLDGYVVALDDVVGLGEFVEIEATAEAADVDALRSGAFECCRRLGLDPAASVQTSYLGMLLDAS